MQVFCLKSKKHRKMNYKTAIYKLAATGNDLREDLANLITEAKKRAGKRMNRISGGEALWDLAGAAGGAGLGYLLARVIHDKPSVRTRLLYSLVGAGAGGAGTHIALGSLSSDVPGLSVRDRLRLQASPDIGPKFKNAIDAYKKAVNSIGDSSSGGGKEKPLFKEFDGQGAWNNINPLTAGLGHNSGNLILAAGGGYFGYKHGGPGIYRFFSSGDTAALDTLAGTPSNKDNVVNLIKVKIPRAKREAADFAKKTVEPAVKNRAQVRATNNPDIAQIDSEIAKQQQIAQTTQSYWDRISANIRIQNLNDRKAPLQASIAKADAELLQAQQDLAAKMKVVTVLENSVGKDKYPKKFERVARALNEEGKYVDEHGVLGSKTKQRVSGAVGALGGAASALGAKWALNALARPYLVDSKFEYNKGDLLSYLK